MDISISTVSASMADFKLQALKSLSSTKGDIGISTGGSAIDALEKGPSELMAKINQKQASYQAEFSVLAQLKSQMAQLGDSAEASFGTGKLTTEMSNEEIKQRIHAFADAYNKSEASFDQFDGEGGMCDDQLSCEGPRFAMYRDINSPFNGAANGVRGLPAIGIEADQGHQIKIDDAQLDAMLASNKEGVVAALNQFGDTFNQTADTWGADQHVLDNRMHRLADAVNWVEDRRASLEAEFGKGNQAAVSGYAGETFKSGQNEVTRAMSAMKSYNDVSRM